MHTKLEVCGFDGQLVHKANRLQLRLSLTYSVTASYVYSKNSNLAMPIFSSKISQIFRNIATRHQSQFPSVVERIRSSAYRFFESIHKVRVKDVLLGRINKTDYP